MAAEQRTSAGPVTWLLRVYYGFALALSLSLSPPPAPPRARAISLSLPLCSLPFFLSRARSVSLSLLEIFFSDYIANVQGERAESARVLVELQQAQEQIKVITQVLSRCFTVVRALSRLLSLRPPPFPSTPSLRSFFFFGSLPASDTGPFVFLTSSFCLCLQNYPACAWSLSSFCSRASPCLVRANIL